MTTQRLDINEAMSICLKNNIRVYPIVVKNQFKIEVNNNGKIKKYNKLIDKKELSNAITNTYKYFANEVLLKQNKKNNA